MQSPRRIVSLISSATEILFGIGAGPAVVGISHECDFPPEACDRPRLTSSHINAQAPSAAIDAEVRNLQQSRRALYAIEVERLAALQPDLIVTQSQCDVCAVDYGEVMRVVRRDPRLQATKVIDLHPQSLADVFADIERIGIATGRAREAVAYRGDLQTRLDQVRDVVARTELADRPRTVVIEWIEPIMLAANWTPELVQLAGGEPGLTVAGQHSQYASWNAIVDYDPQVIVVSPCGFDLPRTLAESEALPRRPEWQRLEAVRTGRVYALDGNAYLNRSGPRLVDSVEILAWILHPERFPMGVHPGVGTLPL